MADFPDTPVPSFTQPADGEPIENETDESEIINDQDLTAAGAQHPALDDENMGAMTQSLESLEDEPTDFMRGDIDVKTQMDRAANALDASIHGWQSQADEDDPRGDLGATFRDTPGGIEEVAEKTDQDLAAHHRHPRAATAKKEVQP